MAEPTPSQQLAVEAAARPLPDALREVAAAADQWRQVGERLENILERVEKMLDKIAATEAPA
jgi:hypothetical protein